MLGWRFPNAPPSPIRKTLYGTWFAASNCWLVIKLIGSLFVVVADFCCGCLAYTFCGWQVGSRFHCPTPVPGFITPGPTLTDLPTGFVSFVSYILYFGLWLWFGLASFLLVSCCSAGANGVTIFTVWLPTDSLRLGSVIFHSASIMVVCVSLL